MNGFYRINNVCTTCPNNYVYNSIYSDCEPICADGEIYSRSFMACACKDGNYRVQGKCTQC